MDDTGDENDWEESSTDRLTTSSLALAAIAGAVACFATGPASIALFACAGGIGVIGPCLACFIRNWETKTETPPASEHREPAITLNSVAQVLELNPESPPQPKRWAEAVRQESLDVKLGRH